MRRKGREPRQGGQAPSRLSGAVHSTLSEGGDGEVELNAAIDNIFHHPNVGPFICRQLIQHLVTSNPSPAYVARVSRAFESNIAASGET